MTGWIGRVESATALRSEEPRNRFARWIARWRGPTPAVPATRFQQTDETHPGHWRRFVDTWPITDGRDRRAVDEVAAGVAELPTTWRAVVVARDALGQSPAEVARALGVSPLEQRAILNRARASLRERVSRRFGSGEQR